MQCSLRGRFFATHEDVAPEGVLLGAALVATVMPAVRAARVDPIIALRADG